MLVAIRHREPLNHSMVRRVWQEPDQVTQGRKQRRRFFTLASKRREDNPRRRRWRRVQPQILADAQPEVRMSSELWGVLLCRQERVHARPEGLSILGLAVLGVVWCHVCLQDTGKDPGLHPASLATASRAAYLGLGIS